MKRVIIYGTGREFKRWFSVDNIHKWMKENDISIVGVANNNPNKFGKRVNISESIYEIKYIGDIEQDSYDLILVTSMKYFKEIKEFLVSLGILEDRIVTLESFIKQIVNETSKCKYGISIAAIVKDEAEYIEEWIEFHIIMGIEHFYIYDNESKDGTTDILKNYEKIGLVTYIFWPGKSQQIPAYSNAIDCFKFESKYIAFIDVDEFMFSVAGNKIIDEVNRILKRYESLRIPAELNAAAIGVNWRTYGTSFNLKRSDDLVIKRFVYRTRAYGNFANVHIKSIYNPRTVLKMHVHNASEFLPTYCCISENGSEIPGAFFRDGRCQWLRINHYQSKSEEEYIKRKEKGEVFNDEWTLSEELIKSRLSLFRGEFNEYYDPILVKYSSLVEEAIKKRRSETV